MTQSYANQKRYHIQKKIEKEDVFIMLPWKDYTAASNELTPAAMKLFMYLAKNQDGYEFWFSSKDYCQTFKLADSTFRKAKKELLDLGYLKESDNNHVYFNTQPVFKETKEKLQKQLQELGEILRLEDYDSYQKLLLKTSEKHLKEIKDENLYKIEIKDLIQFAELAIKDKASSEIKNLL